MKGREKTPAEIDPPNNHLDSNDNRDGMGRTSEDDLEQFAPGPERVLTNQPDNPARGTGETAGETRSTETGSDLIGQRVGPYLLLEVIGEGGMGTVYRARQSEPIKRTVALKLIRAEMDTAQVIARFEAERQALALMDHPNIAQVLDAGTTESGRPYFVMELINGLPLTRYCNQHQLALRERLELFVSVISLIAEGSFTLLP